MDGRTKKEESKLTNNRLIKTQLVISIENKIKQ